MFPPGFFAADYFAPGYWPDATEATAAGAISATIAGAATLAAAGTATTQRPQLVGGGAIIRSAWPIHPRGIVAELQASISGTSTLQARAIGIATSSATLPCGASLAARATSTIHAEVTAMDNAFWAMAA